MVFWPLEWISLQGNRTEHLTDVIFLKLLPAASALSSVYTLNRPTRSCERTPQISTDIAHSMRSLYNTFNEEMAKIKCDSSL